MRLAPPAALVAALLLAVPARAAVAPGPYAGKTDQRRAVSFTVKQGRVVDFRAGVLTFCLAGDDSSFETDAVANVPPIRIAKDGRFRWSAPDETDGVIEMTVKGRITGSTARGTVVLRRPHSDYDAAAGMTMFGQCSADRAWTARRR
jgi:hypothetical protein